MPELSTVVSAAESQAASGNLTAARELLADAVEVNAAVLGPDHPDVLAASGRLAAVLRELGIPREARRVLEAAQEAGQRTHGPGHPQLLALTYELAVLAHELGNAYEAGRNFRLIEQWGSEALGREHPHVLAARRYLGEDVPGEIDAPPPLPLPPVEPARAGSSVMAASTVDEPARRPRLRAGAAVGAMALLAVLAAVVGVWAIPRREARVAPPAQAGPAGPPPSSASADASASAVPSASLSASGTSDGGPGGGARTPTPTTAPAALGGGRYVIHLGHNGMCVGLGPELFKNTGRTVLGQHPCGSGLPQFSLEPAAAGTYRILVTDEDGTGCADVDYQGTTDGLLLAPRECADRHADQRFTFEPVTTPVAGYRLRSVAGSQWCIGALEGKKQSGVQLMQADCNGGADQVFTLERR